MSEENLSLFRQILTSKHYHVTASRQLIFELLNSDAPQSIRDILIKARGEVDRVSLYRTVELFTQLGIAHRVYIGWKYTIELSDKFIDHHHHLSCLGCGKIIDIQDEAHIDLFIGGVAKKYDFNPLRHRFEIEGYCASCVKQTD